MAFSNLADQLNQECPPGLDLDVGDIELLTDAVLRSSTDITFDLNADAQIDLADRHEWVKVLRATYFGDSNLDGEFNSTDLVTVFLAGKYEQVLAARWNEGDWDGNGRFGSSDLVAAFIDGGYEQGPRTIADVTEPNGALLLAFGAVAAFCNWRRKGSAGASQLRSPYRS